MFVARGGTNDQQTKERTNEKMSMFKRHKSKKSHKHDQDAAAPAPTATEPTKEKKVVLVIDNPARPWAATFRALEASCERPVELEVHVAAWEQLTVVAHGGSAGSEGRLTVSIRPSVASAVARASASTADAPVAACELARAVQISPDGVLVRALVRGLCDHEDYRNALMGLLVSGVPAVTSLESVHANLDRPVVYAQLAALERRLGHAAFPLVPLTYYSAPGAMLFTPEMPFVAKVGSAEAGYGKLLIESPQQLSDGRGTLMLHRDFVTAERFVAGRAYDIRVQKIGEHIRVYRRTAANWKGNVGTSLLEEVPPEPHHVRWATECGKLFGGLDILTVDAIHTQDGQDVILEINDSASGVANMNRDTDMRHIAELLLHKMGLRTPDPPSSSPTTPSTTA